MTKEMDEVHVGLYGGKSIFGGREVPLEASIIKCSQKDNCSFYNEGQCMAIRSLGSTGCKYGMEQVVRGYTSRAKKYSEFKTKWVGHEKYQNLKSVQNKLGIINNEVVLPFNYIKVVEDRGEYVVIGTNDSNQDRKETKYIPLENFTAELIYKMCVKRPYAVFGGEIISHRKEEVPKFLASLKRLLPDVYSKFIKDYPEFDTEIDYVGRKAKLLTVNPSNIKDNNDRYPNLNSEWYWDGEYLNYVKGYVSSITFLDNYEVAEYKIKPTEDTTITITENVQVNDDTVFVG